MVEVTNRCPACGATTRPKAVFCHHCGRPLTPAPTVTVAAAPPSGVGKLDLHASTDAVLKTDAAPNLSAPKTQTSAIEPVASSSRVNNQAAEMQQSQIAVAATENDVVAADKASETTLTQSDAASDGKVVAIPIKRKSKRYINRTEYVWEAGETPTWRVVLSAVIALILVGMLVWLSNSLR